MANPFEEMERKFQSDEKFKALKYEDQLKVRSHFTMKTLQADETFNTMSSDAKMKVFEHYAFRPPVFVNSTETMNDLFQSTRMAAMINPMFQEQMAQIQGLNDDAMKEIGLNFLEMTLPGAGALKQLGQRIENQFGDLTGERVDFNTLAKKLADPEAKDFRRNIFKLYSSLKLTENNGLLKFFEREVITRGRNLLSWVPFIGKPKVDEKAFNKDFTKMVDYLDFVFDQEEKMKVAGNVGKFMIPIYGVASEVATYMYTLAGGFDPSKAGGVAKGIQGAFQGLKYKIPAAGYKALMHGSHIAVGGLAEVLRQGVVNDIFNERKEGTLMDRLSNANKYFWEGVLWDVALTSLGGALKFVKGSFKYSFGDMAKQAFKPLSAADDPLTVAKSILSGDAVDESLFRSLPKESQANLFELQSTFKTLANVSEMQPEEYFKVMASSKGYISKIDDAGKVKLAMKTDPIKTAKTFNNIDDASEHILKQLDPKVTAKAGKTVGAASSNNKISQRIEGQLGLDDPELNSKLARIITPTGGTFTSNRVNVFAKTYMKSLGVADNIISGAKVIDTGKDLRIMVEGSELMSIPKHVTPSQESQLIGEMVDKLGGLADNASKTTQTAGNNFLKLYDDVVKKEDLYSPMWAKAASEKLGWGLEDLGEAGYRLVKAGETMNFSSIDELGNFIVRDRITPQQYSDFLNDAFGIKLLETKKGFQIRGDKKIYSSIDEIMQQNPSWTPKIPSDLGPDIALVDNTVGKIVYEQNIAIGSYHGMLDHLSKFRDYTKKTFDIPVGNGIKLNKVSREFTVSLDEIGYSETFGTLSSAKKFMSEGSGSYDILTKASHAKGYRITPYKGQWILYSDMGSPKVFSNIDDVKMALKKVQVPEWAPELTGFDMKGIKELNEQVFTSKPFDFKPQGDVKPSWYLKNLYKPIDSQLYRAVKASAAPEEMMGLFRGIERARNGARALDMKMQHEVLQPLFKKPNGKLMSIKDRKLVGILMEAEGDLAEFVAKNSDMKFKDVHIETATKVRELFGSSTETAGLFSYFGVDHGKFVNNYLPRLKKFSLDANMTKYGDAAAGAFLHDAMGGNVPNSLGSFFKHSRVSDMVMFLREDDPYKLLSRYISTGHREAIIGPMIEKAAEVTKGLADRVDTRIISRMNMYLSEIAGVPSGYVGGDIKAALGATFQKLGFKSKPIANDLVELVSSSAYGATMAWRVWLPIRNTTQILTTLGPRIGNTFVDDAMKAVADDTSGKLFKEMIDKGVLQSRFDIPVGTGDVIRGSNKFSKIVKSGLKHYRNSDDYTRVVAYIAAAKKFDYALEGMKRGMIKPSTFVNRSGISLMDPDLAGELMKRVELGDVDTARHLFAEKITAETMFPYRAGMGTTVMRGTPGKLFGQMGFYPIHFTENIRRGLRNGTFGQKLGFAGRFLANGLALYAGAKHVFGVEAKNYLPWNNIIFTGGPHFQLLNDAITAMNTRGGGLEGNLARRKFGFVQKDGKLTWDAGKFMGNAASTIVPGSYAGRSLMKGIDHWNKGDYYRAMLSFGSFPLSPEGSVLQPDAMR